MEATEEIERIREAIKELKKIDEKRKDIISKWNEKNIKDRGQYILEPTSEVKMLEQAGEVLYKELLDKFKLDNSNILEIMAGNGIASDFLFSGIDAKYKKFTAPYEVYDSDDNLIKHEGEKGYNVKTLTMTDIVDYRKEDRKFNKTSVTENFEKLNTVDAVKKYGETSNILLLICPNPDCEFADYFAIKDFIEQTREREEEKYIVLFGNFEESGGIRMDGSEYLKWYLEKCCRFEFGLLKKIHFSTWWIDEDSYYFKKRRLEIYKIKPKVKKTSDGKSKSSNKKKKRKSKSTKKKRKSKSTKKKRKSKNIRT